MFVIGYSFFIVDADRGGLIRRSPAVIRSKNPAQGRPLTSARYRTRLQGRHLTLRLAEGAAEATARIAQDGWASFETAGGFS